MKTKSGFTIMELIVVVVIIGVLAAIAIPSYQIQMQKMKNQEAIRVLTAVWEAQKDYYRETGTYFSGGMAAINSNLAITVPPMKNFTNLYARDMESYSCASTVYKLAKLESNDGAYHLFITDEGRILCSPCSVAALCIKMGFPLF